jgi:hypothetical protein
MSPAPTYPSRSRKSLLRWITGGVLAVAVVAALAVALWPASETEKARQDGEQLGMAVNDLSNAQTAEEVDAALIDVQDAVADTADHAGDEVAEQVDEQADALDRTVDGFVGMHTTDSEWDAELYEYELDVAVDDLTSQAEDFRTQGPEVQQAFWDGYQDGLNAA